jgi:BirA family biotin operon repressor/biotin-[acetyl-CoA-carboxylase] ligase
MDLEFLNESALRAALAGISQVTVFPVIDSTNTWLLAQAPAAGIRACLADCQTAGRGRMGRQWVSPPSSGLYLSLRRDFAAPPQPALALALGAALLQVLQALGAAELYLKWPNDILWRKTHKLAGILVETRQIATGGWAVVAGVGINVLALPAQTLDRPVAALARLVEKLPPRNVLAGQITAALAQAFERFAAEGFAPFLPLWQQADGLCGQALQLRAGQRVIKGMARGISADGGLRLETEAGIEVFYSAQLDESA